MGVNLEFMHIPDLITFLSVASRFMFRHVSKRQTHTIKLVLTHILLHINTEKQYSIPVLL